MLPLDLHVLCLPLAFILSQDQTLHCIISLISLTCTLINGGSRHFLLPVSCSFTKKMNLRYFLGFVLFYITMNFCLLFSNSVSLSSFYPSQRTSQPITSSVSECKITTFLLPHQIFFKIFFTLFPKYLILKYLFFYFFLTNSDLLGHFLSFFTLF